MAAPAHRPLEGILVLDLTRYLPGPLVTRLLADLGARVLKVEEPTAGDPSRQAPPLIDGTSSLSALLLAGHESIALDLKRDAARQVLLELVGEADVLVESFRPGVLAGWGCDPEELRRRHPRLVICSVTGWGQSGPHAHRAGHDLGYQAVAGSLAASSGMPAIQAADLIGGWSGALAVSSALHRRGQDDDGCWIDQSLFDAAGHAALMAWSAEADGPKAVGESLPLTGALPCYNLYATRDGGQVAMAALEPKFWRAFCDAVERPDLLKRQISSDPEARRQVAELIASRTRDEWAQLFADHDIPAEPVLSPAEARVHPQTEARGWWREGPDGMGRLGYPALFDGERPTASVAPVPRLGEHTTALVDELGLAADLSSRARRKGGVGRRFSIKAAATKLVLGWMSRSR